LRTLYFNAVFFSGLALWTLLYLPLGILLWLWQTGVGKAPAAVSIRNLVHLYGKICCRLLASQTRISAADRASPLPYPCIITANHQSFFDPYTLGFFPVKNIVFVVRTWPFRIPLYGRIMRLAGYLNAETLECDNFFDRARAVLREGAAFIVFPEGTRSSTGKMGRFHSGAFKLAMDTGTPVIPLCIDGTGEIFPKGSRFGRPAAARLTLLPAVYPKDFARYRETAHLHLQRHVKSLLRKEIDNRFQKDDPDASQK
jgi:1-acyl-sn-glycerol-3-phosphate acyltransferase